MSTQKVGQSSEDMLPGLVFCVYIGDVMGYVLPKAVTLLLGEVKWRLLEVLPFYMLYLLICSLFCLVGSELLHKVFL